MEIVSAKKDKRNWNMASKKRKKRKHAQVEKAKKPTFTEVLKANKKKVILCSVTALILCVGIILGLGFGVFGWGQPEFKTTHYANIELEGYGTVRLALYGEEAPKTVEHFVKLVEDGVYDGLTVHKVIKNFLIQAGRTHLELDPVVGEFRVNGIENDIKFKRGTVALFHPDENDDGATSQFFIVHKTENATELNGSYAAFGEVVSGMKIIDKICETVSVMDEVSYEPLPISQPKIVKITVEKVN